jgi:dienelactone hydrolase
VIARVGAGIGGFAVAYALTKRGFEVDVNERSDELGEVGLRALELERAACRIGFQAERQIVLNWNGTLRYSDANVGAPLILIAPNWLGVTPKAIAVGEQIALAGYVAFLIDMRGRQRRPTGRENPIEFLAPLFDDPDAARALAGFDAALGTSRRRGVRHPYLRAALGFCLGGANVLDLARSGADVAAAASVHGNLQAKRRARIGEVKAAVPVAHGAQDPIAPKADRDAFEAEMSAAGVRWTMLTFGGVRHSFMDRDAQGSPVSQRSSFASNYLFHLAYKFIADGFSGALQNDKAQ